MWILFNYVIDANDFDNAGNELDSLDKLTK